MEEVTNTQQSTNIDSLAFKMLKKSESLTDRAKNYTETIKRNLQRQVIDELIINKEKLEDRLYTLKDFSLDTDINKGVHSISREEAQKRFKEILEIEYDIELVDRELKIKQESFDKYFK